MTKTHKQQIQELRAARACQLRLLPLRAAMVVLGVGLMWWEGQQRPDPGVGFAVAMMLFIATVMIGWTQEDDQ